MTFRLKYFTLLFLLLCLLQPVRAQRYNGGAAEKDSQRADSMLVGQLRRHGVKFSNDSLTTNQIFKRFFNEEGYKEYGNEGSVRDYFKKQSYGKLNIDFDVVGPFTVSHKMEYYGKHYRLWYHWSGANRQ